MNRYNPTEGDLLIENRNGREAAHIVTDVDRPEVSFERPDGVQVTKLITELRRDLLRGTYSVQEA